MAKKAKGNRRTPSDNRPHASTSGKGKSAERYTSPTGKKLPGKSKKREAVSGGPRKTGRG